MQQRVFLRTAKRPVSASSPPLRHREAEKRVQKRSGSLTSHERRQEDDEKAQLPQHGRTAGRSHGRDACGHEVRRDFARLRSRTRNAQRRVVYEPTNATTTSHGAWMVRARFLTVAPQPLLGALRAAHHVFFWRVAHQSAR
jgi:hypothetical protein